MTISLLRRIWNRIHAESAAAPPKQRLTGFEPLEPRMVLSGFMAHFGPDYFSPPPGDFSHIDRSGAEIAQPAAAYGGYAGYGRETAEAAHNYRPFEADPFVAFNGRPAPESLYIPPLLGTGTTTDLKFDFDSSSSSDLTVVGMTSSPVSNSISYSVSYISIDSLAVDRILADMRPLTFSGSQVSALMPMTMMSVSMRSLTDRDYTPVNSGGAVEQHAELHEYAAPTPGSDASPSVAARSTPAAERSAANAALTAAQTNQSAGTVDSVVAQSTDGSSANRQDRVPSNTSADHQQNGLLELTEGERLKLKRKSPGSAADLEEATSSTAGRGDQYDDSATQVPHDPARPFNAVTISEASVRPLASANMADDGLIEVLAADVTAIAASGDVIEQAAANSQLVMEPAVATYQAFEVVLDGDSQTADTAAEAARLVAALAVNNLPLVQAE